mmetsp:Transcript_20802/g.32084  ORF Transcript_20802/g.32084 Transcript_20802/m.32084 type:complete len:146 (-) Transcript_20802:209-646(-)
MIEFAGSVVKGLKKQIHSDEMQTLCVKNLVCLLNALYFQREEQAFAPDELFKKVQFVGRKVMLDIKTAEKRLMTILKFFRLSLDLLGHLGDIYVGEVSISILKLAYRTSTDDQYKGKVRELSQEIVDHLQETLPKNEFIQKYNEV